MLLKVMKKIRLISVVWLVLVGLSPGLCAQTYSMPKNQLKKRLSETVVEIRNGKTSTSRTEAAEHIATLTRGINPHKVNETTLAEMISLLDTQEDSVRAWV